MTTTLLIAAFLVLAGWAVFMYNRLVRDRNHVRSGWSDIDVQLQRRHNLIPNLVDAVKAYADYERATMTAVTELRRQSERTDEPAAKARIEHELRIGLDRLLAVAEDYPDLKANRSFLDLQTELSETEDKLQYARRFYNGAVRQYNTRIESFPDLVIARTLAFRPAEFFDAEAGAEAVPAVRLDA